MRNKSIRDAALRDAILRDMMAQAQAAQDLQDAAGGLEKWVGRIVKVGFEQDTDSSINEEWMWVEVKEVRDGRLVGVLQNNPIYATYIKRGDMCKFTEDDIAGLIPLNQEG